MRRDARRLPLSLNLTSSPPPSPPSPSPPSSFPSPSPPLPSPPLSPLSSPPRLFLFYPPSQCLSCHVHFVVASDVSHNSAADVSSGTIALRRVRIRFSLGINLRVNYRNRGFKWFRRLHV